MTTRGQCATPIVQADITAEIAESAEREMSFLFFFSAFSAAFAVKLFVSRRLDLAQ